MVYLSTREVLRNNAPHVLSHMKNAERGIWTFAFLLVALGLFFATPDTASACECSMASKTGLNSVSAWQTGPNSAAASFNAYCNSVCGPSSNCDMAYVWVGINWGDGTQWIGPRYGGNGSTESHVYAGPGTYNVSVTADWGSDDGCGGASQNRSAGTITVAPSTHLACVSNSCVTVAGGGANECATDTDCCSWDGWENGACNLKATPK